MSDLLSGITSLTKQIGNNIPYQIKKLGESVHTIVMNYTEAENLVYEATNEDPWGPTGPQMKEIANYTFQYDGFHQVTNLLWKRMLEDNKNAWRRVYKSLTLLNHLLFHGSERVIGNARDHMFQMRSLEQYKYVDERGRDQGLNVRHRVKVILDLLNDDDKLRAQRKKMKSDNKDRYQGYTSEDIRMGRGGAYNSTSMNSYSDEWKEDSSDSHRNKSSYDDSRDDYSTKEVNSFQFPDETRGSVSPELGIRQDPTPEEDFGDFATAQTVSQPIPSAQTTGSVRSGALHIPALRPPGASVQAETKLPDSVDLLGLDAPTSTSSSLPFNFFDTPTQPQSSLVKPIPPPGGRVQPISKPGLGDDLFGATSANAFVADWAAASTLLNASEPRAHSEVATFDAFTSTPVSLTTSATFSTVPHQPSGLDDTFAALGVSSQLPTRVNDSPAKSDTSFNGKPAKPTKIGSTWAGASGLIDLDNLASKNTPTKQGLSLNQMQMNKQASQNISPW